MHRVNKCHGNVKIKFHIHNDYSLLTKYCIASFFEVLKFHEWPIFSFFTILSSQMGLSKVHMSRILKEKSVINLLCDYWQLFFQGDKFLKCQHPQNLQNVRT